MTWYLSNRDGNGKTSEEGHFKFQTAAFGGMTLEDSSLQVTQNSPAGMSVLIASGNFKIDTIGYSYTGWNNSSYILTGFTADTANPKISSVVVYVDLSATTSASQPNNPGIIKVKVVNGTPAASPSAPNSATIQSSVGASNPYIIIANVTIPANATTIINSNISDTRVKSYISNGLVNSSSVKDKALSLSKIDGGTIAGSLVTTSSGVVSASGPDVASLVFSNPTNGMATSTGTNTVSYDLLYAPTPTTMTRSGSFLVINVSAWYDIVANIRCIDVPKATLHNVLYSLDNGVSWLDLAIWSPWTWQTFGTTYRSLPAITLKTYLNSGTYLRHVEDHSGGATRIGGPQTNLTVSRIK